MRTFLNENGSIIRKLIIYQVGIVIFALAVSTPLVRNVTMLILADCLAIGLQLYLIYLTLWEVGAKDALRIEQGRMAPCKLKGLYIALVANALNIFLAAWVVIARIFVMPNGSGLGAYFTSATLSTSPEWVYNLYTVPRWIVNFFQLMYAGIFKTYMPQNPFSYFIAVLPPLAVATVAYILGTKNFRFVAAKPQQK